MDKHEIYENLRTFDLIMVEIYEGLGISEKETVPVSYAIYHLGILQERLDALQNRIRSDLLQEKPCDSSQ